MQVPARSALAVPDAPMRLGSKVHAGELLPDQITPLEQHLAAAAAAKAAALRHGADLQIVQIGERREVRDFLRTTRPDTFQPGGGGALPGTTLRLNGFDLAASVEHGLKHDHEEAEKEAKRQVVARRVEGGGNNGLGAVSVGATAMGIFFLGPLGAAAGIGSTLFDAVKGPELIFVNGQITGDQVKLLAQRFEKARGLPKAITAALVRRALHNARPDLDGGMKARMQRLLQQASSLPGELLAEGERVATVAIFARRLEGGLDVSDDDTDEALDALFGMAPANRRALTQGLRGLLFEVDGAPRPLLAPRFVERFDAALS